MSLGGGFEEQTGFQQEMVDQILVGDATVEQTFADLRALVALKGQWGPVDQQDLFLSNFDLERNTKFTIILEYLQRPQDASGIS